MPTPSAVSCKVNRAFKEALAGERFFVGKHMEVNPWGSQYTVDTLRDRKDKGMPNCAPKTIGMRCCGLEELDCQNLSPVWQHYNNDKKLSEGAMQELVARYIKACITEPDHRMVFIGIPTSVGAGSIYNLEFYEALKETLLSFGFKQLCEPYKNKNSGNTIVALAGQL